jgi:hypothetical protein
MGVSPLPRSGGVQFDRRDAGRALRVSAHPESDSVVVSIWRGDRCVATHQMATADVPEFIQMLASAMVPASATRDAAGSDHRARSSA